MFVLHSHWQPPRPPNEPGGMIFWAETPNAVLPPRLRGTLPKKHKTKDHPFTLTPQSLREAIGQGTPLDDARESVVTLRLPTSRSGPLPSPDLRHDWEIELDEIFLAPWIVRGLWLPASKAFSVLVNLPADSTVSGFALGTETRYWRMASNLVLETLAAQKLAPDLDQAQANGRNYSARWRPVLDGPRDGPRLAALADGMPAICRAELRLSGRPAEGGDSPAARGLLEDFLGIMCDSLARTWGRGRAPVFENVRDDPVPLWLMALFREDAVVRASTAQLNALNSGLRAWLRYLSAAGDNVFHVAFRLEAPGPLTSPQESLKSKDWHLDYLLQAREDPNLVVEAEDVWRTSGSAITLMGKRFEQPQEKLLAGLGYAARLFSPILPSLQTSRPEGVSLDTQAAYSFLRSTAPLLEQAGFGLVSPPWWNQRGSRLGVRLRLQPVSSESRTPIKIGLDRLVRYSWELSLGETSLTREEFEALVALKAPLVQIRGQWVQLDSDQVEAARRFWDEQEQSGELTLLQAARFALGAQPTAQGLPVDEVEAEGWIQEWLEKLSSHEKVVILPQPDSLEGELREYQRYGYSWLTFFRRYGLGAVLADDMGLGKTIQALALLLREKEQHGNGKLPQPYLLVCPTSVVTNWQHEVRRFAPSLKTLVHQGAGRLRGDAFKAAAKEVDLVLSSYAVVRQDAEFVQSVNWGGVIVDEAQNIKNPAAKQTQVVRKLNAAFRLAMTGTPVENRLQELWSIMNFLNPGYLGSQETFRRNYALPIERFGDREATQALREIVSPFILRRVKTDPRVIRDLPDKIEMKEYALLTEEQATLYEAVVQDTLRKVQESEGMARRGLVLALLMQLKQVCNHPAQYLHQIDDTPGANLDVYAGRSGKLTRLVEMLDEVTGVGDRALVFTQFAEMGRLLTPYLQYKLGVATQFLHGGTPIKMREQMVRRFEEDPNGPPVFILSLKAGGLGLNLTRATHVFHFDRWWNPAVENQATDRAFRIGQHRNVQVHKFITAGTLEEKIDDMIESKRGLAEAVVGSGEHWLTELSTDELRDLVALRRG